MVYIAAIMWTMSPRHLCGRPVELSPSPSLVRAVRLLFPELILDSDKSVRAVISDRRVWIAILDDDGAELSFRLEVSCKMGSLSLVD